MLPTILLVIGYLVLPGGFYALDAHGPATMVSALASVLVALSFAAMVVTWRQRRHFVFAVPLVVASLYLLGTVLFLRFV